MGRFQKRYQEEIGDLGLEQAIINHKSAVLETNMAMQKLKDETHSSLKEMKKKITIVSQSLDENSRKTDEFIEKFIQYFDDIFTRFRLLPSDIEKKLIGIKELIDKKDSYFLRVDDFEIFMSKVDEWISQIRSAFERQKDVIDQKAIEIKKELKEELGKICAHFDDQGLEESKRIDEISIYLDRKGLDYSGFKEELEILKRQIFVLEKHNENLYTQIARLKDGKK